MDADRRPVSELSYAEALSELDRIVDELAGDAVDVDGLAAGVQRAAELIQHCRERIEGARLEVERITAGLDRPAESSGS